ncbi:lysine N(6)-hydroxylase/L-ornithine N(5)-oxygenase family protein [Psychrobacter aquaticus]|uniref:Siderophore biosynthesis protein, monooxygenase n=1 Tax=Psychrobacter aquaticus CMS 56 TaxID=1354303 RepID=U4T4S7_9GAMM|nr:SidA/IucD/PvdA family monooxygenase [Psychrobacter aquaticus]ERL55156.1 Siderophore biosynthesis protein, monooxygenase [Psychrobacter aquaticus CMS 56]
MLDLIGIGLGPFNLSLAALLEKTDINAKFFEQKAGFNWHKGMILPHTTLQVPFMADLVTLIDPTSPYSFLNYLHTQHRLLKFYFLEDFKIYRKEYNHYCQWVAGQLDSLAFDSQVVDVAFNENSDGSNTEECLGFVVTVQEQGIQKTYYAKNLVIGTGTQPTLPPSLQKIANRAPERCMHTANFADNFDFEAIKAKKGKVDDDEDRLTKIVILGSGQSSAEVYRALFDQQFDANDEPTFQLDWMTRSAGFFPMEYSPLGLEHFSPAYTDYFYQLDGATKANVAPKQDLLYKGMGFETIRDIYHKLYERSISNQDLHTTLLSNCGVVEATLDDALSDDTLKITFEQCEQQQTFTADYDCVIAGTGYRHALPSCLNTVLHSIAYDDFAQPKIDRNYALVYKNQAGNRGKVFVQNQEIHTHGVGTPDLGLGAYRAGQIINQLTGTAIYNTEALQVFQTFGASS